MIAINRILVATDFSEASSAALLYGMNLARTYRAQLDVVHVVNDLAARVLPSSEATPDAGRVQTEMEAVARHALDALLAGEDRRLVRARAVLLTSAQPADRLVSYARDAKADLIVMGTHGRTSVAHFFMGSVAQHVVRSASCPVLTVRHSQRDSIRTDELARLAAS
jgi:nucleotide-binding universal stress UspA family protein